jgi:hypothetical protein
VSEPVGAPEAGIVGRRGTFFGTVLSLHRMRMLRTALAVLPTKAYLTDALPRRDPVDVPGPSP